MVAFVAFAVVAVFAGGFGAGRVHHPANLKLSAVKAEIAKVEVEAEKLVGEGKAVALSVVNRLKSLL